MTGDSPHFTSCLATKYKTKKFSFTDNTRFFELTVDLYADPLTLLAFGSEVKGDIPPKKYVAINGPIVDVNSFFKEQFIWQFKEIFELSSAQFAAADDWLVLEAN